MIMVRRDPVFQTRDPAARNNLARSVAKGGTIKTKNPVDAGFLLFKDH
jgi:hypothetical protein